jgi:hypothetical protein
MNVLTRLHLTYRRFLYALLLGALLSQTPTSQALMAGAPPDTPAARIDANTPDSPWAGVVAIRAGNNTFSGVAVSAHHILTAAHVANASGGDPAKLDVMLNSAPGGPIRLSVSHIEIFPSNAFPYDDLGLLTLAESLPDSVPTYPINDLPPETGKTLLTLVGYGDSGQGNIGVSIGANPAVKRVGENMLDALTPRVDKSGHTSSFYFYDFDGPEGNGPIGSSSLGNARETSVSSGDSGSPAFTLINGYQAITGINTFASPLNSARPLNFTFGQGGGGMLLSDPRFLQWLKEKSAQEIQLVSTLPPRSELNLSWPLIAGSAALAITGIASAMWWKNSRSF